MELYYKKTPKQAFSFEYCEIFAEHLQTAAFRDLCRICNFLSQCRIYELNDKMGVIDKINLNNLQIRVKVGFVG